MEEREDHWGKEVVAENQRLYMRDFLREISGLRLFLQNPGDYRVIKDQDVYKRQGQHLALLYILV